MPSAAASRIGEVARIAAEISVPSDTLPALSQIVDGQVQVTQLRPIQIEDLLRRETIGLDAAGIGRVVEGQVVVVTGAGGSIGSELCRQILRYRPKQLLLLERSEVQLFPIEQELLAAGGLEVVVPQVADVTDQAQIRDIFRRYRPSVIFHAAAHKHVRLCRTGQGPCACRTSLRCSAPHCCPFG